MKSITPYFDYSTLFDYTFHCTKIQKPGEEIDPNRDQCFPVLKVVTLFRKDLALLLHGCVNSTLPRDYPLLNNKTQPGGPCVSFDDNNGRQLCEHFFKIYAGVESMSRNNILGNS